MRLVRIKEQDDSLSARSCREGVCGSDAMNTTARTGSPCITKLVDLKEPVELRPCRAPVILRPDRRHDPVLQGVPTRSAVSDHEDPPPEKSGCTSPEEREELDGLYECILCACCSTPAVVLVNPDNRGQPAAAGYRFSADSRDQATASGSTPSRILTACSVCHNDHELRRCLPEEPQPDPRDRQDQELMVKTVGMTK